jgi:hypothetical protein
VLRLLDAALDERAALIQGLLHAGQHELPEEDGDDQERQRRPHDVVDRRDQRVDRLFFRVLSGHEQECVSHFLPP